MSCSRTRCLNRDRTQDLSIQSLMLYHKATKLLIFDCNLNFLDFLYYIADLLLVSRKSSIHDTGDSKHFTTSLYAITGCGKSSTYFLSFFFLFRKKQYLSFALDV